MLGIVATTAYESLGVHLIELRVFNGSDIQHFPVRDGDERPSDEDTCHDFCSPTPDQWNNPYAVFRMVVAPRGTKVPRSELQKMITRNMTLKPSLPPVAAMATCFPLGLNLASPVP